MKEIQQSNLTKGLKLSIAISVVVSIALLTRTLNIQQLKEVWRIQPLYLVLALLLVGLMWFAQGMSMTILARALGEKLTLAEGTKNYLCGSFVSNVTPSSSGGGPFQVLLLHRMGISLGKATSIITVQWSMRHLLFGIFGPIFFIFYGGYINPGKLPPDIFRLAVYGGTFITVALLFFVWKPQVIPGLARGIMHLPGIRRYFQREGREAKFTALIDKTYHEIEVFHECLWTLAAHKKLALFSSAGFIALFWVLFFSIAPVLMIGLGAKPFFLRAIIMQTIMFLIIPYIPTPGASGVAELGFAAFFAPFVPLPLLGILAVAWRLLTYYFSIFFGGLITLRILATKETS